MKSTYSEQNIIDSVASIIIAINSPQLQNESTDNSNKEKKMSDFCSLTPSSIG